MSDEAVAVAVPHERVTKLWMTLFFVAWFGYWTANLLPYNLLLPSALENVDAQGKVVDFAVVMFVSGVVALIALPLAGALCDRSRSRFGRRKAWIAGGSVAFAAGLVITAEQTTVAGICVAWAATQLGLSGAMAGLTATVADRVPERQRGLVSSLIYVPQAIGPLTGITLIAVLGLSTSGGYMLIAGILLVCVVPFLFTYREATTATTPNVRVTDMITSLGESLRVRDFAWAFGGRVVVNLTNSLGTCYTLYFLTDELKVHDVNGALLAVTATYVSAGVVATVVIGPLSDRLGRRRVFVAFTALLQAAAGIVLTTVPTFGSMIVSSALFGAGFGAYMAVDQAIVTQVLPDAESRAKDLGIMNIGAILPTAVAPLLASVLIRSDGYSLLFTVVGVSAAIGAAMVCKIRSVR